MEWEKSSLSMTFLVREKKGVGIVWVRNEEYARIENMSKEIFVQVQIKSHQPGALTKLVLDVI